MPKKTLKRAKTVKKTGTTLTGKIKKAGKKLSGPIWKGPEHDGVTQSFMNSYLACRERFRIRTILGLKPIERFSPALAYGNMWHICEEFMDRDWETKLRAYAMKQITKFPLEQDAVEKWWNVCKTQFQIYLAHYAKDHKKQKLVLAEVDFVVPYKLPSGRTVTLRGKWDGVILQGKKYRLKENKTKGRIDEDKVERLLDFDIQTMLYIAALRYAVQHGMYGLEKKPVDGVMYNVVRKPLSGGVGSIRPKKGSKNVDAETLPQYYARLGGIIEENLETFFMRWDVEVSQADISRYEKTFLQPILENILDDYEWWSYCLDHTWNQFDYTVRAEKFPHHQNRHYRHPFGTFNWLNEGGGSGYDEYLKSGSTIDLNVDTCMFPELEEED